MAGRIRSIKPELLDDEVAAGLSDAAWRLFVSSWILADDHGCFRAGARYLAAQVWQDTRRDALTPLLELADLGRVLLYEVEGQPYAFIPTWDRHQRVDNAGKRRVPAPPTNIREVSRRFAETLRGPRRGSATFGGLPLGPKTLPLDLRSPISDHDPEHKARVGFEAAPPSGAGPSHGAHDDPELLAHGLAPATPSSNLASVVLAAEEPVLGPALPPETTVAAEDAPAPSARPASPATGQPEPAAPPPADAPTGPASAAPVHPGPAAAPVAVAPGPLVLPLELVAPAKRFDPVEAIFAEYVGAWKRVVGGRRPPKLDDKRRRLTTARLREFAEEDLKAAARGVFASEWNVEAKQTDYDLVMRDAKHVERFMACDEAARAAKAQPPGVPDWLSGAARPSPRVLQALRENNVEPPSGQDGAVDFRAILRDVGSIEVIDE